MSDDSFSYDDWFSYRLAPDGDIEDGCHPDEAQAMKDYLRQKTTVTEAAQAITYPVTREDDPTDNLHRLWGFLEDSLVELPSKHIDPLILLLQAIEALPKPDFAGNHDVWEGLGNFGHMWSDGYMNGGWRTKAREGNGPEYDISRERHVRKAEIEARIVQAGIGKIPIDWGYEVVADALESSNAVFDFEIPAAANWLVICGQIFRQGAEKREESYGLKPFTMIGPHDPSRDLRKAPLDRIMTLERWSDWEHRLKELEGELGVVGEAAKTALGAMQKLDDPST
ncbi:hypothetical protein P153DRAFT_370238 [Dothidotthia symphoricarpi CBS 119687]|uniref:Uncharacterized protein n=1 Tax=Dothidotthia symphoricarpi CBS 119687 TaxID=1392245 RepID=A0A6A6A174_9PLEO|nr:uncharacterized protein P153DRAFT_370238 [Dothidotthia symphoricarpi CBS 119687]KAF2125599.1 hypothetical protein P153DRAFT_370238 [Dothidotthia symphoricarpi CBS 119687]